MLKNPNYKNSRDDTVRICRFLHVSFTQDGTVLYHAISDEKLRKQLKKVQYKALKIAFKISI